MKKLFSNALPALLSLTCLVVAASCGAQSKESSLYGLVIAPEDRWESNSISVCWENGTHRSQNFRDLVRDAVESEFNQRTNLKFVGWDKCEANSKGIRMVVYKDGPIPYNTPGMIDRGLIIDGHPRAFGLGKYLDGRKPGVMLNYLFIDVATSLSQMERKLSDEGKKNLRRSIAVHEFGHVAGLYHEQSRADSECLGEKDSKKPPRDSVEVGVYDKDSIMNYCVTHKSDYSKRLTLSAGDIAAINALFPAE